mgnify:FL=1
MPSENGVNQQGTKSGTYAGYEVKAERQAMSCIHRIRKVIGGVSKKLEEHLGQIN